MFYSEAKRKLPADDHGPVHPSPKPAQVPKVSSENISPSDKTFKYYASEKEKEEAKKREMAIENSLGCLLRKAQKQTNHGLL